MDLRATLNLPDPAFTIPMKADLPAREPEIQKKWEEMGLYQVVQNARRGSPKFILHDGPPYTNSPVHIGTMLNKALKDFVVRYKTLRGFHAPYVPGYDNHGLAIELAVQAKHGRMEPGPMREACRKHADEFIKTQTEQFRRYAVLADWDNPYATMHFAYEASIIRAFSILAQKGFIYRDLRPTHWSIKSRTALADTELVYEQHTSTEIYVRFPLRSDPAAVLTKHAPLDKIHTIIWTTTPWTIPANFAVAYHPELSYALVEADGEYYLLYDGLVAKVFERIGKPKWTKLAKISGKDLEGVVFKHPVYDRDSLAVLADYVTTEDGTGVVHTAPGHGHEDFYTGRKYNLPIVCPVDEAGVFTGEAFQFAGISIKDADTAVPEALEASGNLLANGQYQHSYPYSERDNAPVIYRTTEQWFLSVDHDELRGKALVEVRGVDWIPPQGEMRITAMVGDRPDWCLSRQRVWGVGIPIVYGVPSGRPVLDPEIMELVAKLVEKAGSGAWFEADVESILPNNYKHPETGETEFRRETDVLDVWFDSGITHMAVLDWKYNPAWEDLRWPADIYLEGSDQHRGWFNSSLMTGVALKGAAPYGTVLTHGFVVDEKGEKMSKSKGNVVDPADAASRYGVDVLRYWAASVDYSNDVPCGENLLKQMGENYRRVRNTLRFLLANLYDYDPQAGHKPDMDLDEWAVEQARLLEQRYCREMDRYDFNLAISSVHNFCVSELSSFYLDAIKDAMYCDAKDSRRRRSSQAACHEMLLILVRLIAPFLPHTADEVYERIPMSSRQLSAVLEKTEPIDDATAKEIRKSELQERFAGLLSFRERMFAKLEAWKTEAGVKDTQDVIAKVYAPGEIVRLLESFGEGLPNLLKLSWVEPSVADGESYEFRESNFLKCERCRLRRPDVEIVNDIPLSKRDRAVLGL